MKTSNGKDRRQTRAYMVQRVTDGVGFSMRGTSHADAARRARKWSHMRGVDLIVHLYWGDGAPPEKVLVRAEGV